MDDGTSLPRHCPLKGDDCAATDTLLSLDSEFDDQEEWRLQSLPNFSLLLDIDTTAASGPVKPANCHTRRMLRPAHRDVHRDAHRDVHRNVHKDVHRDAHRDVHRDAHRNVNRDAHRNVDRDVDRDAHRDVDATSLSAACYRKTLCSTEQSQCQQKRRQQDLPPQHHRLFQYQQAEKCDVETALHQHQTQQHLRQQRWHKKLATLPLNPALRPDWLPPPLETATKTSEIRHPAMNVCYGGIGRKYLQPEGASAFKEPQVQMNSSVFPDQGLPEQFANFLLPPFPGDRAFPGDKDFPGDREAGEPWGDSNAAFQMMTRASKSPPLSDTTSVPVSPTDHFADSAGDGLRCPNEEGLPVISLDEFPDSVIPGAVNSTPALSSSSLFHLQKSCVSLLHIPTAQFHHQQRRQPQPQPQPRPHSRQQPRQQPQPQPGQEKHKALQHCPAKKKCWQDSSIKTSKPTASEPESTEGAVRLFRFLMEELEQPRSQEERLLAWVDRSQGLFRIVRKKEVADKWGRAKNNQAMTYEKFSRSLRYYYKIQQLQKMHGQNLLYKFGPRAHPQVWSTIRSSSFSSTSSCSLTSSTTLQPSLSLSPISSCSSTTLQSSLFSSPISSCSSTSSTTLQSSLFSSSISSCSSTSSTTFQSSLFSSPISSCSSTSSTTLQPSLSSSFITAPTTAVFALSSSYKRDSGPSALSSSYKHDSEPSNLSSSYKRDSEPSNLSSSYKRDSGPSALSSSYKRDSEPSNLSSSYKRDSEPSNLSSSYKRDSGPSALSSSYKRDSGPSALSSSYKRDSRPSASLLPNSPSSSTSLPACMIHPGQASPSTDLSWVLLSSCIKSPSSASDMLSPQSDSNMLSPPSARDMSSPPSARNMLSPWSAMNMLSPSSARDMLSPPSIRTMGAFCPEPAVTSLSSARVSKSLTSSSAVLSPSSAGAIVFHPAVRDVIFPSSFCDVISPSSVHDVKSTFSFCDIISPSSVRDVISPTSFRDVTSPALMQGVVSSNCDLDLSSFIAVESVPTTSDRQTDRPCQPAVSDRAICLSTSAPRSEMTCTTRSCSGLVLQTASLEPAAQTDPLENCRWGLKKPCRMPLPSGITHSRQLTATGESHLTATGESHLTLLEESHFSHTGESHLDSHLTGFPGLTD